MIINDMPITTSSEDRLNRASFAKCLSQAILGYSQPASFSIGIYGKWGIGKTSLLNMTLENVAAHDPDAVILRFNPWLCSDARQLIIQFFRQLSGAIHLKNIAETVWQLVDEFANLLNAASLAPYLGGFIGPAGQSLKNVLEDHVGAYRDDLQRQKNAIERAMQDKNVKIVVSIDDIDRLSETEIVAVFQLVKSLADFPNTVYLLAFDYDVVVNALEKIQYGKGREYLEKVIQVPFEIPAPKLESIHAVLTSKLNELLADLPQERLNETEWYHIYEYGVHEYVRTIRDVNRYVNVFSLKYALLKDETDLTDLLGLTCLQVFEPETYSKLPRLGDGLCGSNEGDGDRDARVAKAREVWSEIQADAARISSAKATADVLCTLFPRLQDVVEQKRVPPTKYSQSDFHIGNKIASPKSFDRYFSLMLESDALPTRRVRKLILESDADAIAVELQRIHIENRTGRLIEDLSAYLGADDSRDLSDERIGLLLQALTRKWSLFDDGKTGFLTIPLEKRTEFIAVRLLRRLDRDDRQAQIEAIFDDPDADPSGLAALLRYLGAQYGRYGEYRDVDMEPLATSEFITLLEERFIARARGAVASDAAAQGFVRENCLWLLRRIDSQASRDVVAKLISGDEALIRFIACGMERDRASQDAPAGVWRCRAQWFKTFIEPAEACRRALDIARTAPFVALPEDDRLALAAFACLMERGAERLYDECVDDGDARARLEQLQQAGAPSPDDGGDTPADDGADAPADDDSELPPATGISIG